MSRPKKWEAEPGYESLVEVLRMAHDQAAYGKGKVRHANEGEAFSDQHIMQIAHHHGPGHATGQAEKKARESNRLPPKAAVEELLGAIVYSAAAVIAINTKDKEDPSRLNEMPPAHKDAQGQPKGDDHRTWGHVK